MKKIAFDSKKDVKHFEMLFEGLGATGARFSVGQARILDTLMTKFENVSTMKEGVDGAIGLRTLRAGKTEVILDDAEWNILLVAHDSVPWVNGNVARQAVQSIRWIEAQNAQKE